MRTVRKNKQKMYYSLLIGAKDKYKLDKDGNKIVDYIDDDGTIYYRLTGGEELEYSNPVEFFASISFGGSDADVTPFGISNADYDATIVTKDDALPIDETSLIWVTSEVKYLDQDETIVDVSTADYSVKKVTPSLNYKRYELKAIVK